jgi:hypothetical protein
VSPNDLDTKAFTLTLPLTAPLYRFYYSTPYDLTLRSLSLNYLKIRRPRVGVYGIPLNAFKDWSKDVSGSMPMSASQFGTAGQVVTKG